MKVALCLLTRNELPCLKIMMPQIPAPGPTAGFDEVFAVDGGSTDGSVEFFNQAGVRVVSQKNRGRGDAFHTAFKNSDADAIVFFSPDGNEAIADLPRFRAELEKGADLVIASRMMKGAWNEEDGQVFKWRKWANNAFNWLANLLFNRKHAYVTDSINGYRAIRVAKARELKLDAVDYSIEYQMTIRALQSDMKIVEFPTHEGERVAGDTGAPSISTGLRFIKRLWAEWKTKGAFAL